MREVKPKSFWSKPEGKTGMLFGAAILGGLGYALYAFLPIILGMVGNIVSLAALLGVLAVMVYVVVDPKMRNLIWYIYKSIMRFITGVFVEIDPIGIIESYIDDLKGNLKKMGKQISLLRGQMRKLKAEMDKNKQMVEKNLRLASRAKEKGKQSQSILKVRKAGRLQDSNLKLGDLYKKMEVMYRVLCKMYETSEILLEDVQDEVSVKKREREAIRASHSAMKSARNIISGNADRRALFDQAMEGIADDIGEKVGEMERFMEISENFMDSVDLQNGVYEEKGLEMLEKWEKEGMSVLLGEEKGKLIRQAESGSVELDLDAPVGTKGKQQASSSEAGGNTQYGDLFDF